MNTQNPSAQAQTITIEIDAKTATARHIAHLQQIITDRNATIAKLEERMAAGEGSPLLEEAHRRGYEEGWRDNAHHLINALDDSKRALEASRRIAIRATRLQSDTEVVQAFAGDDE